MKAIVQDKYGSPDVLELREIDQPVVKDDDVLVRVHAASVNPADWHLLTGTPYVARMASGLRKPKVQIPGLDMAGRVEAVGGNVTQFRPGDEVFGQNASAYAEYVCVQALFVVRKPANLSFAQAAAVPVVGLTAYQAIVAGEGRRAASATAAIAAPTRPGTTFRPATGRSTSRAANGCWASRSTASDPAVLTW